MPLPSVHCPSGRISDRVGSRESESVSVDAPHAAAHTESPAPEWRAIPGWEGFYEASDGGQIRRVARGNHTRPGKILKPFLRKGYPAVDLCRDGIGRTFEVHTLVARAFLGEPPAGHEIDHRDRSTSNNAIGNLRYVTRQVNLENRGGKFSDYSRAAAENRDLADARRLLAEAAEVLVAGERQIRRNEALLAALRAEWPEEPTVSDRADDLRCFAREQP